MKSNHCHSIVLLVWGLSTVSAHFWNRRSHVPASSSTTLARTLSCRGGERSIKHVLPSLKGAQGAILEPLPPPEMLDATPFSSTTSSVGLYQAAPEELLKDKNIVVTPGVVVVPRGDGYPALVPAAPTAKISVTKETPVSLHVTELMSGPTAIFNVLADLCPHGMLPIGT
jgi:hypothetical protein